MYKPFGEVRYTSGTLPTKYTFTGQYSNVSDFGLMYYNARWVDPVLRRFTQADTLIPEPGNPQSWDRYSYVNNSPLMYTDPSGHGAYCGDDYDPGCLDPQQYDAFMKLPSPTQPNLALSDKGYDFIVQFESVELELYEDSSENCTIGIGHLVHYGVCNGDDSEKPFLDGITENIAHQLFRSDLMYYEQAVNDYVTEWLSQTQFDALVSLTFNIGVGYRDDTRGLYTGLAGSDLLELLNEGNYEAVPIEMARFVYGSDNQRSDGLVRRRTFESNLFQFGIYDFSW